MKISLFMLAVGVSAVLLRSHSNNSKASSNEDYWAHTGLTPETLEDLLFSGYCGSTERHFLACAAALLGAGEQRSLTVGFDGRWTALQKDSSQRESLLPWSRFFWEQPEKASRFSFKQAWQNLLELVPAKDKSMITGFALNASMSVLRDPHTYLIPIEQFNQVVSETEPKQNILGLSFARTLDNQVVISRVLTGTPAHKAGIRPGDLLFKVNGTEIRHFPRKQINELLKSELGGTTKIILSREGKIFDVETLHEQVELPSVSVRVLESSNLAVLSLNKFARGTCERLEGLLSSLNKTKVQGVLLDMRGNPGGSVNEANCILGLFIGPEKKAFEVRYLDPQLETEIYYTEKRQAWVNSLAVLVDGGSASSAEILAGSLRDHKRAILVGDRTYGKGSFQEGAVWDFNSEIAIFETKGFFYLPSGETPQLKGLLPDVWVQGLNYRAYREDNQFLFPLIAPQQAVVLRKADIKSPVCQTVVTGEDKVVDKAASLLFCNHKVARVER